MNYHFLTINRGRYLCSLHGSFCDSSDGYLQACPLCGTGARGDWSENRLDRALQVVGNLQKRSSRNLAVVSGLLGAFGALSLFGSDHVAWSTQLKEGSFSRLGVIGLCSLVVSLVMYVFSMSHMQLTTAPKLSFRKGEFQSYSLDAWEIYVAGFVRQIERLHLLGNLLFASGVLTLVTSVVLSTNQGIAQ